LPGRLPISSIYMCPTGSAGRVRRHDQKDIYPTGDDTV
jgi:hypothetical protein